MKPQKPIAWRRRVATKLQADQDQWRAEVIERVARAAEEAVLSTQLANRAAHLTSNIHSSDCAVHNEPAEPKGPCSGGATFKVERRYVAWLSRLAGIQVERWKTQLRSWRLNGFLGR